MAQALYRKWRSQTFEEVVGQQHVTQTLRNALRDGRVAHAYLFSGPRGTGKTSTARILAKALNCTEPEEQRPCNHCPTCVAINEGRMLDLIEIDAASNNSVDDVRELREKVGFRPSEGRFKIYIIDEVHMLSNSAFNALLKTLEEPPPHARFILATTEPHKIPATVLSRCQRFDFRRIPVPEIASHLDHIVQVEGFGAEDEALTAIARSAQGGMRDAVSLLDQMLSYGAETVTLAQVQQVLGAVNAQTVGAFVETVTAKDASAGLGLIQELVSDGVTLTEFTHQVVEHLRGVMVLLMAHDPALLRDLPDDVVAQMERQASQSSLPDTLFAIKRFSEASQELKGGVQPQLPLELALIESIQGPAPAQTVVTERVVAEAPAPAPVATPAASPTKSAEVAQSPPRANSAGGAGDVEAAEPTPMDEAAIQRLRSQWKEFLNSVREQAGYRVQAALNTVRDIAISDYAVAFAFGTNQFSHDMVAKPETLSEVGGILSSYLGRSVKLECQMGDHAHLTNMVGMSSSNQDADGKDPLLEYAVSDLGAELTE